MGLFARFRRGVALTKCSFRVLVRHPQLLVFPLVSGIASIAFFVALLGPIFLFDGIDGVLAFGDVGLYLALFGVYFGTTFISTYFNAALVHAAGTAFAGNRPSVGKSLSAVTSNVGRIVVWSLIAATVSIAIRVIEERVPLGGAILAVIFSVGWSILTFFVVPVMVFEDTSILGMFRRSGETFKQTWGETIAGGFGITLVLTLLAFGLVLVAFFVPPLLFAALGLGAGSFLVAMGSTWILVAGVLIFAHLTYVTVWGILKTALYGYAKTGRKPEEFESVDFDSIVSSG